MIDPSSETLLSLAEAARAVPAVDGKRPHPSTIFRWMRDGIRGVRLEHLRVGRRIVTTPEALARFMREAAEAPTPEKQPRPVQQAHPRTPKARQAAIDAAAKRLEARGVKVGAA